MTKPRRPFSLITGGAQATAHPLFTPVTPPPMHRLKAQIVSAAETFANEADAAGLCPDRSPAGVALLALLDAVHELQHHETRPGASGSGTPASRALFGPPDDLDGPTAC